MKHELLGARDRCGGEPREGLSSTFRASTLLRAQCEWLRDHRLRAKNKANCRNSSLILRARTSPASNAATGGDAESKSKAQSNEDVPRRARTHGH
jgi:hypothetical protein